MRTSNLFSSLTILFLCCIFTACEKSEEHALLNDPTLPQTELAKQEASNTLYSHLTLIDEQYALDISKEEASSLGISPAFYDNYLNYIDTLNINLQSIREQYPDVIVHAPNSPKPENSQIKAFRPILEKEITATRSMSVGILRTDVAYEWAYTGLQTPAFGYNALYCVFSCNHTGQIVTIGTYYGEPKIESLPLPDNSTSLECIVKVSSSTLGYHGFATTAQDGGTFAWNSYRHNFLE